MIRDRKIMGGSYAGGVEWQQRRRIHGTGEGGEGWGVGGRRRAVQRKEEVRRKGLRGIREIHRRGRGEGWGVGGGNSERFRGRRRGGGRGWGDSEMSNIGGRAGESVGCGEENWSGGGVGPVKIGSEESSMGEGRRGKGRDKGQEGAWDSEDWT